MAGATACVPQCQLYGGGNLFKIASKHRNMPAWRTLRGTLSAHRRAQTLVLVVDPSAVRHNGG